MSSQPGGRNSAIYVCVSLKTQKSPFSLPLTNSCTWRFLDFRFKGVFIDFLIYNLPGKILCRENFRLGGLYHGTTDIGRRIGILSEISFDSKSPNLSNYCLLIWSDRGIDRLLAVSIVCHSLLRLNPYHGISRSHLYLGNHGLFLLACEANLLVERTYVCFLISCVAIPDFCANWILLAWLSQSVTSIHAVSNEHILPHCRCNFSISIHFLHFIDQQDDQTFWSTPCSNFLGWCFYSCVSNSWILGLGLPSYSIDCNDQ